MSSNRPTVARVQLPEQSVLVADTALDETLAVQDAIVPRVLRAARGISERPGGREQFEAHVQYGDHLFKVLVELTFWRLLIAYHLPHFDSEGIEASRYLPYDSYGFSDGSSDSGDSSTAPSTTSSGALEHDDDEDGGSSPASSVSDESDGDWEIPRDYVYQTWLFSTQELYEGDTVNLANSDDVHREEDRTYQVKTGIGEIFFDPDTEEDYQFSITVKEDEHWVKCSMHTAMSGGVANRRGISIDDFFE
ncbi:hypothetical protein F4777DRAFT_575215 [Nemania sp. FL0916]|nr:hypothetical protein F4777DRAFT_575215 [Nemania sp. FL0916]